jgi:hypothetical protein
LARERFLTIRDQVGGPLRKFSSIYYNKDLKLYGQMWKDGTYRMEVGPRAMARLVTLDSTILHEGAHVLWYNAGLSDRGEHSRVSLWVMNQAQQLSLADSNPGLSQHWSSVALDEMNWWQASYSRR